MREGAIFSGTMPVFLPCRNKYDIPRSDGYFFFIRGDDTFAFRDNGYLFGRVGVKFVPYTLAEVYLLYQEVFTQVFSNNRLQGDRTGKLFICPCLFGYLVYFD